VTTQLTWNLAGDVQQMLSYPFMVNALRAGGIVAIMSGAVGWMMVLRRESFAGHTLAVIGFPGAAAAAWLGVAVGYGYVAACLAAAVTIAACSPLARGGGVGGFSEGSAVIGTVQAVALATGLLFVSLYHGFLSGLTNLLFGTIAGVSGAQVWLVGAAALMCLAVLGAVGRPLLFTSIDPVAAAAHGVPTRLVAGVFLVVLGITAGAASELTGSLLVFALLVAPAAAAQQLTPSPSLGIIASVLIALAITWMGMGAAFFSPYPIGFWVASLGYGSYLAVLGWRTAIRRLGAVAVSGRRDHEG
jgi:zinc/manganese transport system permease protein